MTDAHANFATSTVATAPSPATSGTSLVVAAGEGTRFPAVPFFAIVAPADAQPTPANAEIVRVTAGPPASDTFTTTRAQQSSSARTIIVGDRIYNGLTNSHLTAIETVPRDSVTGDYSVITTDLGRCKDITATSAATVTITEVAGTTLVPSAAGRWFEVRKSNATGAKIVACTGAAVIRDPTTGATTTSVTLGMYETVRFTNAGPDLWVMTGRYDPDILAIGQLTSAADKGIQFTGSGTAATYDLTTAGKALLDDANAAAQLTTLGVSSYAQTVLDDTTAAVARATLGVPRALFDHFADVSNGASSAEIDLYSDTIAAGQLANNGEKLVAWYGGVAAAHATNTRTLRVYFGGSLLFISLAFVSTAASQWTAEIKIIRVSSTVIRYAIFAGKAPSAGAAQMYTGGGELTGLTLANTNVLKLTGQNSAAASEITAQAASVRWEPAA